MCGTGSQKKKESTQYVQSFSLGLSPEIIAKYIQTAAYSLSYFSYFKGYSFAQKAFLNKHKIPNTLFYDYHSSSIVPPTPELCQQLVRDYHYKANKKTLLPQTRKYCSYDGPFICCGKKGKSEARAEQSAPDDIPESTTNGLPHSGQ